MSSITRSEALESLYRMRANEANGSERYNEVVKHLNIIRAGKGVPDEVVQFLEKEQAPDYAREFFNNLKGKKFYKNLKVYAQGNEMPTEVVVKALSSLVTHAVIDIEIGNVVRQTAYSKLMIQDILNAVEVYFQTGKLPDNTKNLVADLVENAL